MKRGLALLLALVASRAALASPGQGAPPVARAACGSCHAAIEAEWQASAHRSSATNAAYARALRSEPLPFCRGCHLPSADPRRAATAEEADRGIGCTDCHGGPAELHGPPAARPRARACAGCHEFAFPSGQGLMQKTATEHRASAYADRSCESCHMPRRGGHVDHRFLVDEAMLARSVVTRVTRVSATRIAVRLAPGEVGHATPTGDLFRRLEVVAEARDGDAKLVARASRVLARVFTMKAGGRVEVADERVGAGAPPCFELALGDAATGRDVSVRVLYQRVQEPGLSERSPVLQEGRAEELLSSHVLSSAIDPGAACAEPRRGTR